MTCQQNKSEHTYPAGLLQPLPISKQKWTGISMDFIIDPPRVQGKDCIYVELFKLVGTELTPSTSYHPQTDRQTEIVNKWVEGYLRNYVSGQQKAWVRWLYLGEYCYNTMHHMSIGMMPFRALYGYEALSFIDLALSDSRVPLAQDWLQENQDILRSLRENLQHAQNQQKIYADRHRIERAFEVDDMALGQHITVSPDLPPMDEEGKLTLVPEEILEVRERRLRSRVIREYLVRWRDLPIEDATWEGEAILQHPAL
ncbi:uncharacterized protein LOC131876724 [Cryptomeria japonica]|uniref:uncharacterized protein LOC131876724 n=1 Tax=Cryptomeria japonica TaxID=3369 RepID=UPI0027DAB106|nr:uncharacterized protein LOC131876724 [Cryptomeria japonica]